jgi:gamma-glutamylcyclotransferase (GGCT)/AIG2-like uncharacterized protein YtfP
MENLFSYGTLQSEKVQIEVFGRIVKGETDSLIGYKKEKIKIQVDSVVHLSGVEEHVIISYSGKSSDVIEGMVFFITSDELAKADEYETDDYKRIKVQLKSGKEAWVYVKDMHE